MINRLISGDKQSTTSHSGRKFDLNIEKILEDWEAHHAVREVIANAIDEQILTKTKPIEIYKDESSVWHIRDFGRGLRYEHLTQKENEEKLQNPHVIGKFGIGLKDALATFDRKNVSVNIKSKYGEIRLGKSQKHGFEDVVTLHAYISPPTNPKFVGTEFVLIGVTDSDISKAKDLFLLFSGERVIEETKFGQALERKGDNGRIYINGVRVAEEENFIFSYNITSLTKEIRKALNRERTNVGRSAYSGRIKSILLSCQSNNVAKLLVSDLEKYSTGRMHDELAWIDVQEHAVKILNATEKVVFMSPDELIRSGDMIDEAIRSGYRIITVPDSLRDRISGQRDISGGMIRDLGQFFKEYTDNFEFKFVDPRLLRDNEKKIFNLTESIFALIGGKPSKVKEIRISETMRKELGVLFDTVGVWDPGNGWIIIKRTQLNSMVDYAGTLLHETVHAISGTSDVSRAFESELTKVIGLIVSKIYQKHF